jgi:DNA-binding LytR/AlgR family response regulator
MNMLRTVVVDDEPLARRRVARLLRSCGCEVMAELGSVRMLLQFLEKDQRPDALFLDIEMPGGSGMEALAEFEDPIPVVFITAYAEHAVRAFDASAVDYILKPIFKDRLEKALEKVREKLALRIAAPPSNPENSPKVVRFPARAAGGHFFLEFRKVSHFEFEGQAVWAWCGGKRFRAPWDSLNEVESAFPMSGLIRIQRHLLLRPEAVLGHRSLPNGRAKVRLMDGIELDVSRSMTPRLREVLGIAKPHVN